MLLAYGDMTVPMDWMVEEKRGPGFSRLYHVHSGEVLYKDSDVTIPLTPGKIYLFPSGAPFCLSQNPHKPLNCTFLHLDISPHLVSSITELDPEELEAAYLLLRAIRAAIRKNLRHSLEDMSIAVEALCLETGVFPHTAPTLMPALCTMLDQPSAPITLKALSSQCGYSPEHFLRLFRKYYGVTPHQYLISLRMNRAAIELRSGTRPVTVGENAGYSDYKSFGKAFKTHFGMTPTTYLKNGVLSP